MKTVAVVPAFHEASRIGETVRAVLPYVDRVVVIDDGSSDATAARAFEAGATVLRHRANRGQGAALKTGTEAALKLGADVIVHVDADGQHDPESIPVILAPLKEGSADIVFGSRFLGEEAVGMPQSRRLLLGVARAFSALAIGIPRRVSDPQSGFRAMTAASARRIDFKQDRMAHCTEILRLVTRSDLRWREVPARIRYTPDSLKKGQKPWDAARIVWHLFLDVFNH